MKTPFSGRRRGDCWRVPPPLQDGQVQHAEGDQGAGQQEGLQKVLSPVSQSIIILHAPHPPHKRNAVQ